MALHSHESWALLGNLPPCHFKDVTEEEQRRAIMMKKIYRATLRGRIRQIRTPQLREETL